MTTLLQTKLTLPSLRPALVGRSRLQQRLDAVRHHKLVLISAPAGFGKTTLIAAFSRQMASLAEISLAWLSLSKDDNDPSRFLAYFLEMVKASNFASALDDFPTTATSPDLMMTEIVNALTAVFTAQPDTHLILVLDDYHLLHNTIIHEALTFLLEHMPPQMHLVITTRADPPLPLARWRASGQLLEIRQHDLCFTEEEAADFLNRVMGLQLSAADVQRLNERTEGWIAGLQMAAVSIQGQANAADFVQAFSGSHRHVLDYLMEEVLSRQPEAVTQFLLQTAVLDRLCASLCDAVLNNEDTDVASSPSQKILNQLETANLFIVPLDQERHWYRYHRLFVDLLRQRINQTQPALVPVLHQRAATWFEANNSLEEAIHHALLAGMIDKAADLIEQLAEPMLMRSELVTVTGWLAALPPPTLAQRPSLSFYYGWALIMEGRAQVEVEQTLQHVSAEGAPGELALVRGLLAILHGDGTTAVTLAQQALDQLAPDRIFFRGVATWILGLSLLFRGDLDEGIETLEKAVRVSQQVGNMTIAVGSLSRLANQAWRDGDLHRAKRLYTQNLVLATDEAERPLPIAGELHIGLGRIYYEWNELETAFAHAEAGLALLQNWREIATISSHILLARVWQAQGEAQLARQTLENVRQIAHKTKGTEFDDMAVAMTAASLDLLQGDLDAVEAWSRERQIPQAIDTAALQNRDDLIEGHLRKYEFIILARLRLAQKRPQAALSLLTPLLAEALRLQRRDLEIEIRILLALALHQKGEETQADEQFQAALDLAEPGGFVRLFVESGADIPTLLARQQATNENRQTYLHKLLNACRHPQSPISQSPISQSPISQSPISQSPISQSPISQSPISPLIDPLSERELEILNLIAAGLSNQEIANKLVLSLPTIKWHTSNIYSKLGVRNRTTAVAHARELNLLP